MAKKLLLKTIKLYQFFTSPILGRSCRFYPSCSEYSFQSIEKHGVVKGVSFSLARLSKCHPWHRGGVDLP